MSARNLIQALSGLIFLLYGTSTVHAGSFGVNPVRATLSATRSVNSFTVRNNGTAPAIIQIEIVRWGQHEGQDAFQPSREILATPPIFTVPAKGSQIIRVGLRRAPDPNRELSYRMFLQEVPPPPRPGFQGLQVALRLSIPIFVLPQSAAKPVLVWKAITADPGRIRLQVTNTGNAHIQIANFTLLRPGGEQLTPQKVAQQVSAYILPGESREWAVSLAASEGDGLRVSANTDGDDAQAEMTVETH